MPLGISWSRYFALISTSFLSACAGSQLVHNRYKPLEGFEALIESKMQKLKEETPIETFDEMLERYEGYHKQLEEFDAEYFSKT